MSKSLIITKPGVLSEYQKQRLEDTNFILLELDHPSEIRVVDDISQIDGDVVLRCALESLEWGNDSTCRNAFGKLIRKAIIDKIKKQ